MNDFRSEFADNTTLHPVSIAAVIILGTALIALPRRFATFPLVLVACFIPVAQRLVVAGFDFSLLRLMILFGWTRLFTRDEIAGFRWKRLDTLICLWAAAKIITFTICFGTVGAFVNRLGGAFEAVGLYFLFRCLLQNLDDVDATIRSFMIVSIPVAFVFMIENMTRHNLFSVFGGVPAVTMIRDGRLRCQGAFSHPIIAGCFWATLIPLMAARWWRARARTFVVAAFAASFAIIIFVASSTPLAGVAAAVLGAALFPMRENMRALRWSFVFVVVCLDIVMKAPVWHLISRVDLVGGSTGYHRYLLVDSAIRNFNEWWLVGTASTHHWGHMMYDVANQYVLEGVQGGAISLLLFLLMVATAFGGVGRFWRSVKHDKGQVIMAWALGISLFVHTVNFIGVSYFGQITMLWFMLLAIIVTLDPAGAAPQTSRVVEEEDDERSTAKIQSQPRRTPYLGALVR